MKLLKQPLEFQWDQGNQKKNVTKHGVTNQECEEIFFDKNRKILKDKPHSTIEDRYIVVGRTKSERLLFAIFTLRGRKIRVISARDLNKKQESHLYYEETS